MLYDKLNSDKFKKMKSYKCTVCGYIYDPVEGDPSAGIEPGTPFSDLQADYVCPICGVGKDEFIAED